MTYVTFDVIKLSEALLVFNSTGEAPSRGCQRAKKASSSGLLHEKKRNFLHRTFGWFSSLGATLFCMKTRLV